MQITTAIDTTTISTGTGTMVIAGLQLDDVALLVGMIFTILTFCMSLFFHIRRERAYNCEAMRKNRLSKAREDRKVFEASKREETKPR